MTHRTLTFTYTKPNNEVSYRVGIVMQKPSDNYAMLDVSGIDKYEVEALVQEVEEYNRRLKELRAEYDFDKYWKNFKESRMSDIQDWITPWN